MKPEHDDPAVNSDSIVIAATKFRPAPPEIVSRKLGVRWVLVPILAVIGVLVWMLWYVVTARAVGFSIAPETASVYILEPLAPQIGGKWLLRPGPRRVRVEAPGYTAFDDFIEISSANIQNHAVDLVPLPGHLDIRVEPLVDNALFIDGEPLGSAPTLARELAAGEREIVVEAKRYLPYQTILEIEGKGIEQTLNVVLQPAWAAFNVDSNPAAIVIVDGEALGSTPLTDELIQGRRRLELRADGYKPWIKNLNVSAGKAVNLGTVVMAKADGVLSVTSTPSGASITVDGKYRGQTPTQIPMAPDKSQKIALVLEGYKTLEREVSVASAKSDSLDVTLEPALGTIELITSPSNAELLVDGELVGNATTSVQLAAHPHEFVIRAPGYATYQTTVTPRANTTKRYRVRLKTSTEMPTAPRGTSGPRARPNIPIGGEVMTTSAGQELKLFRGGSGVLGSPARMPGRQSNEIEREVRLQRPFYLARKEVTNAQYRAFLALHQAASQTANTDEMPAAGITWEAAVLYCNWLSREDGLEPFYQIKYGDVLGVNPAATGYRLPTEAEWEWAARDREGASAIFSWGEQFPPREKVGNFADSSASNTVKKTLSGYSDGFSTAAPVGSFAADANGLYDMSGNVAEWVHDFYDASPPQDVVDPLGSPAGQEHVIKGSSWRDASITNLRLAYRGHAQAPQPHVGFRIARYAQ
ncbi:MAG: PEGA domain-containing protein [Pseudomonadota bacterium]